MPLVYLLVAVASIERSQLAVAEAAREAGRAFATGTTQADAVARMRVALRLALRAEGLPDDAAVRVVAADSSCDGPAVAASLQPGAVFTVCVTRRADIPGVPSILAGRSITSVGAYVVHIDDYRTAP